MRKRDRKALGAYLRQVADLMELRDWHLDLSHEQPADDDAYASVDPIFGQRRAVFRFHADFRGRDAEGQRLTVVHELVHCHLAAMHSQAVLDVEQLLGKPADVVFCNGLRRNLEYGVDGLAHALAKHLPLPQWPPAK